MRKLFILANLLFMGQMMHATNTDVSDIPNVIYISPFSAAAGSQVSVSIEMKNVVAIRGFQFDLYLPNGVTAVKSDKGASGISKHIDDYVELRKKPEVIAEIAADMKMVFQKKHKLELITSYKGKDLDITIDNNNVEFLFIFANHDPDKSLIREELEQSIKNHQEKDSQYLDEIKVVKASEMGYGLFAYKDKKYCYPTIRQYIENK